MYHVHVYGQGHSNLTISLTSQNNIFMHASMNVLESRGVKTHKTFIYLFTYIATSSHGDYEL